ncbi:VanZ family protein [Amycolatopsis magusensis]|uniref:Glycopeptide antibiotics resistance protein n=1 Tax=Amycolatopsis magusensis TaxID=882444 RepID=A0ABS4PKE8_9PSEU|nr:glycopeptide antibiotics resistance protein [Amycolatopsis magusensis]
MTHAQATALQYGLLAFLAVWGTLVIPQAIVQYARHGRIRPKGLLASAVFTLYACLALAVVLLPLPGPGTARLSQTVQLVPFQWVADIGTEMGKHGLAGWQALGTLTFQQLAMNVLLLVPLGVVAGLAWRQGFARTAAIGFGVSLAIEFTQVTANFGTAPFVYRIFDVDDLFANTIGAALGWVLAALYLALRAGAASAVEAPVAHRGGQARGRQGVHLTEPRQPRPALGGVAAGRSLVLAQHQERRGREHRQHQGHDQHELHHSTSTRRCASDHTGYAFRGDLANNPNYQWS